MNEQIEPTSNTPLHRQFRLTPLPGAVMPAAPTPGRTPKTGRRLLIAGSAAVPMILTIPSRPAFAKKACTVSIAMSHRNSVPLGSSKKGELGPCGNTVQYWQQAYTKLQQNPPETGYLLPAQVTTNDYLSSSTSVVGSSGAIFTYPGGTSCVAFSSNPSGSFNLSTALNHAPNFVITVTLPGTGPGHSATWQGPGGPGGFFAQAAAAVLNAAVFGSSAFGYDDAQFISNIDQFLATLQSTANNLEAVGKTATQIVQQLQTLIQNEISSLSILNSQSMS